MTTLEERVQRLEDIEAIRSMKMAYARYCDDDYRAEEIAELFTQDGVWDGGVFGVYNGRDAVRDFFANISKQITFALHYNVNHEVDIAPSGTEATGHVLFLGTHTIDGRAMFLGITYDDRYRKIDGRWYFSVMKLNVHYVTPYESGWVKEPMAV